MNVQICNGELLGRMFARTWIGADLGCLMKLWIYLHAIISVIVVVEAVPMRIWFDDVRAVFRCCLYSERDEKTEKEKRREKREGGREERGKGEQRKECSFQKERPLQCSFWYHS